MDFCMKDVDVDRDCLGIMEKYYRGRKRAIKSKGVQGITVKKLNDTFRFSNYCRKRKRACKSKAVAGEITVKKPKLFDIGHCFVLKIRKPESPVLLEDSDSDSRVSNSESESGASEIEGSICGRFDDYERLEEISLGGYGRVCTEPCLVRGGGGGVELGREIEVNVVDIH